MTTLVPGTPPNVTIAPPGGKPVPKIVTVCPPVVDPEIGFIPEATGTFGPGAGREHVALARVKVPAGTVIGVPLETTLSVIVAVTAIAVASLPTDCSTDCRVIDRVPPVNVGPTTGTAPEAVTGVVPTVTGLLNRVALATDAFAVMAPFVGQLTVASAPVALNTSAPITLISIPDTLLDAVDTVAPRVAVTCTTVPNALKPPPLSPTPTLLCVSVPPFAGASAMPRVVDPVNTTELFTWASAAICTPRALASPGAASAVDGCTSPHAMAAARASTTADVVRRGTASIPYVDESISRSYTA
jgi:hypothetical protein